MYPRNTSVLLTRRCHVQMILSPLVHLQGHAHNPVYPAIHSEQISVLLRRLVRPEAYVTSVAAQLILPGVTSIPIAHTITAQTIILARLMEVLGATLTKMP